MFGHRAEEIFIHYTHIWREYLANKECQFLQENELGRWGKHLGASAPELGWRLHRTFTSRCETKKENLTIQLIFLRLICVATMVGQIQFPVVRRKTDQLRIASFHQNMQGQEIVTCNQNRIVFPPAIIFINPVTFVLL